MARLKDDQPQENMFERLAREQREFDEKHPILDTRYWVQEWRNERLSYNGWDQPVPSTSVRKFGPFTKSEFDEFMAKHEPDENHHFVPRHENLRHYCYDKWGR